MLLGGLTRVTGAIRGQMDDGVIAALTGAASVIFGLLALSWPDKTVLLLALLVGPTTAIFGLGQFLGVWRQHLGPRPAVRRRSRPRWLQVSGAVATVILALALVAVSAAIHLSAPSPDAF
jgi:hypothetical protein